MDEFEVTRTQFGMVPDWVDETVTDGNAMRVYVRLSRKYADRQRHCYPSQHTLAAELGLSESTVKRAIRDLRSSGAVQAVRRRGEGGRMGRNLYWLPLDQGSQVTHGPGVTDDPSTNQTQELLTRPTSTSSGGTPVGARADAQAAPLTGEILKRTCKSQAKLIYTLTSVWCAVVLENGGRLPGQDEPGWDVNGESLPRGKHPIGSQVKAWVESNPDPTPELLDAVLHELRENAEEFTMRRAA